MHPAFYFRIHFVASACQLQVSLSRELLGNLEEKHLVTLLFIKLNCISTTDVSQLS